MYSIWRRVKYIGMLKEVERIFSNFSTPNFENKNEGSSDDGCMAKVGVIQLEYMKLKNVKDFISFSLNLVRDLVKEGSNFIVFPYGFHGFLFHDIDRVRSTRELEKISEIFVKVFENLSRIFKVWIYGGELRFKFKDRMHRRFFLFSPSGKSMVETTNGEIENPPIFETEDFSFSPMSSEELRLYEFVKMSVVKGARILIQSDYPNGGLRGFEERRGLWSRCQQFGVYGISSYVVGRTPWGILRGTSGIYGPYWIFRDGVVERTSENLKTALIRANLRRITNGNTKLSNRLNYGKILEVMFRE